MQKIFSILRDKHEQLFRFFLFILTLVLIINFFPRQSSFKYEFSKGKPWLHETIIAPFSFSILKPIDEIQAEQTIIKQEYRPIFNYQSNMFEIKAEEYVASFEAKWAAKKKIKKDKQFTFLNLFKRKKLDKSSKKDRLVNFGYNKLFTVYKQGIIQMSGGFPYNDNEFRILVKEGEVAESRTLGDYVTVEHAANTFNIINELSDDEYDFLIPILLSSIEYNVIYDKVTSEQLLSSELAQINNISGLVQTGEVIISKGEVVDNEKYQKLLSLKYEYEGKEWSESSYYLVFLGQILLVSISLLILFLFIKQNSIEVLQSTTKTTLILMLILLMVVIASVTIDMNVAYLYLVPFCILPIILKAFFNTRIALFSHLITILVIGFIVPNGFEFVFLQLMAGIISILTVLKMYKRAQLFMSVAKIIAVYVVIYIALSMNYEGNLLHIDWINLLLFTGSGVLTLFAYPLIFAFEKLFSLVSDISLLELADTNSPLLRRLSEEAPGTFQHSLQVANLAEEGIIEIGGNALLTRAGAIYHDIGKLRNPMYFIENQSSGLNPHDELSFDESAELIINHVMDGIELAKEHNLPDELIDFIRTHHGTTTVQYFYKQFITNFPEKEVDIQNFTYLGPKPFSKETAVLMMADSAEAAARSLKNPTAEHIDVLIEKIINKQIEQDQFVNADITIKEITQIKKLYKKKLVNIHHARVEY